MKKYILLLLATASIYGQAYQNPTYGKLKLKNNQTSTTATKVNVQETDGTINTKPLSELDNYLEFDSAVSMPVTGEQGKLYLTKDNNRLYRFNGTIYQELTTDISGKEDIANKQNSLSVDGSNTKYPTVTAVNTGLATKANDNSVVHLAGAETITGKKTFSPTLTATANNEILVGLDISPTFNNGAFTGVKNIPIRMKTNTAWLSVSEPLSGSIAFHNSQTPTLQNCFFRSNGKSTVFNIPDSSGDMLFQRTTSSNLGAWYGATGNLVVSSAPTDDNINRLQVTGTVSSGTTTLGNTPPTANNQLTRKDYVDTGLATKEPSFSKNTAFNKNFGTTAGTVSEGNDSRILNGQTAFGWGNHASAGYALTTGSNINQSSFRTALGLGSNAYSSTAYLPLTGGDVGGVLKVIEEGRQLILTGSDQGAVDLYKSGTLGHRLFSDVNKFGIYDLENGSTVLSIAKETRAATFSSTVSAAPATLPNHVVVKSQLDAFVPSGTVNLTGDQTISGQKSFSLTGKIDMQTNNSFPAITATALGSNGQSAAEFINNSSSPNSTALRLQTSSSGGVGNRALDVLNMSPIGTGIFSNASNGGVSISSESRNGDSYISNITNGGTGRNYVGRNNGIETYSVDKTGKVTATSYTATSLPVFENNAAASSLAVGQFYRTSTGVLMVKF